jgi:hypothetical protein
MRRSKFHLFLLILSIPTFSIFIYFSAIDSQDKVVSPEFVESPDNPAEFEIPPILHQSWKTTELPAVSIEALSDRNFSNGDRLGLTITLLGSTNYGQMKKIDYLFPSTIHGFSGLMMNCQKIFIELIPCDTCTCINLVVFMQIWILKV